MLKKLWIAVTGSAALMIAPAIAFGQTVYFNCDVWYDDASNTVYGYNETYTDYTFDFYYEAQVSAQLYENGQYVDGDIVVTSGSYGRAEVAAPGQPNTLYSINGGTYATIYYYQYIVPYYYYYDFGNFSYLIQNDPCYGMLFRVCIAPGPPIWIPMVPGAGIGGVWDAVRVPPFPPAYEYLSNGSLSGAVEGWLENPDGAFLLDVNQAGYGILLSYTSGVQVLRTIPCPYPTWPCLIVNGAKVLATVLATAGAVEILHDIWIQKVESPYGWPGWDGTQAPVDGFVWEGEGPPGSPEGNWYNPSTKESLHPDLEHADPKGPHWDYKDPQKKWWDIWPDGTMTPKAS